MTTDVEYDVKLNDYNAWTNKETWNVSVWLVADEELHRQAKGVARLWKSDRVTPDGLYRHFVISAGLYSMRTPDNVSWRAKALDYAKLDAFLWELA